MRLITLALLVAVACGTTKEDKAENAVRTFEGLAEIAEKNRDDCDRMAEEVNRYLESNLKVFEDLKNTKAGEDEKKAMETKFRPRLDRAMERMKAPLAACPKAAEAMQKINL